MLNVLRESFKTTPYLKWVLIAVGVGLIAYLGNYFVGGGGGGGGATNWVARVNGEPIPDWAFREAARNLDEYYRGMFGQNYEQIKPQLRIRRQALESLIDQQLVLQDARSLGLRGSAADLAERIRTHPSLQDASGRFIGTERYKRVLERNFPGGFAAFERSLAEDLLQQRWTALVTQPVDVGERELVKMFRRRTEKTTLDYVLVSAEEMDVDEATSDDQLRRWYEDHADDYMREAGRSIRFVVVEREAQLETIEIDEAGIRAYYDSNQAVYTHPEQRRARHILLRVEASADDEAKQEVRQRAEQLLGRLRGGEDFSALAAELSEDVVSAQRGGDLDFFGRGQMFEAFEQAAFETPVGELAPVTETPHGFHVVQVTDSRPEGLAPLEEVSEDIRRLLRFRELDSAVAREARRLRDEMSGPADLEQVAESNGLSVRTAFFSDGERIPGLLPSAAFRETVSTLPADVLSEPLQVAAGLAVVAVDAVLPAAPAPYEEVSEDVATALLEQRRRDAALEAARRAEQRHDALSAVAQALGDEVRSANDLAPGQAPPEAGGSTPELEQALFGDGAEVGGAGVVEVPAGALVYRITGRQPFDAARFETEKAALREEALVERRASFRQSILDRLRAQQTVELNPLWLETIDETG